MGNQSRGELGSDSFVRCGSAIIPEGIKEPVIKIASGAYHCLALTSSGKILAWGFNAQGQLGKSYRIDPKKLSLVLSWELKEKSSLSVPVSPLYGSYQRRERLGVGI